jgi:hypothetical protein
MHAGTSVAHATTWGGLNCGPKRSVLTKAAMRNSGQRRSRIPVAWLGLLLAGCGGVTGHGGNRETHFLSYCHGSCSDGLSCVCGVCTKACEGAATCQAIFDRARCVAPTSSACERSAPELVCDVPCHADRDCSSIGDGYACNHGACRQGTPPSSTPHAGAGGAGADGGQADAGAPDAGGSSSTAGAPAAGGNPQARTTCYAALDGAPVDLDDVPDGWGWPEFALTDDGFVGVAAATDGGFGYAIMKYGADGTLQGSVATLWPDVQTYSRPRPAVSGDVLAMVEEYWDEESDAGLCRIAMVRLSDMTAILQPTSYSSYQANCNVVAVDNGFVAFWTKETDEEPSQRKWTAFAQSFDLDGNTVGDPLALAVHDCDRYCPTTFFAVSDGSRAAVLVGNSVDTELDLAFIEDGKLGTTLVEVDHTSGWRQLVPANGGLVVTGPGSLFASPDPDPEAPARPGFLLSTLDREGGLLYGPVGVDYTQTGPGTWAVAPLDTGYVLVSKEEYLVARTLDAELAALSAPTGISDDPMAEAWQLLYAPDGSRVGLIYEDESFQLRFVGLKCSDTPPAAPGPSTCPRRPEVSPLDDGCTDRICHVMVRLDYLTLGLRGWAAVGGDSSPVDSETAAALAQAVFDENTENEYPSTASSSTVSGPEAGLFTFIAPPDDILEMGAFALVGEESGLVVSAGGVLLGQQHDAPYWSEETGHYWVPSKWNDPAGIACGSEAAEATETYSDPGECEVRATNDGKTGATAAEALDVVLRSNLAAHLAEQGPFSAYAFRYTPGVCPPEVAEYLVVLTQER